MMMQESTSYTFFFELCLTLALCVPLLSCIISLIIPDRISWLVSITAPFLLLITALSSAIIFFTVEETVPYAVHATWFSIGANVFTAGFLINNLSATMLLVVTVVSLLVHVYSVGYMADDHRVRHYFAMLGLFTFSMLCIVVADNILILFVGWELVGFSSYMLIGHWKDKIEAARAAKKAFVLNRIGDAGFLVGLMIIWTNTGTFSIEELTVITESTGWRTAATLCLFCGVAGKSAQLPLLNWLPDAMEGPTPVSALIHAATMVAAGVYLMIRVFPLFTPTALDVVAVAGIITALIGALSALGQLDIKRILAYSTISQLGLMVAAVGAGHPDAAFLHLFTHAFFKACLFLAAGSIIHALHHAQHQAHSHFDVQDIRNLGGLRKKLPTVFTVFIIAGSSLAGIPFLSGFLSKDAILTGLIAWTGDGFSWKWLVVASAFVVSLITVLYTLRMIWGIFFGEENRTRDLIIVEPPVVMQAPILILATASLWIIVSWNPFVNSRWINPNLEHSWAITFFSIVWVALGLAYGLRIRGKSIRSNILSEGFYIDKVYANIVRQVIIPAARACAKADVKWIDGFIHASAYTQVIFAHMIGWFDRAIVDGTVNVVANAARGVGSLTRSFQGGKIQLYIFWSVFTIIIFLIWKLL